MPAAREGFKQWNVRLDPELDATLRAYLSNPLLVGLPKKAVANFFTAAIRNELARRGVASCTPTSSSASTGANSTPPAASSVDFF